MTRRNFVKMFDADNTRMIGLPYGKKYGNMLSRFHVILERVRRMDRQGRFAISIWSVSVLSRDKNVTMR